MVDFSIGILSYNQDDYIIELLESLKFQIEQYGKEWNVYLYIVDDCSKDKTQQLVDKWLHLNQSLFADVKFTKNKENKGTVYNHNYLLENIKSKYCKIIAGDDVIGSQNLFECCKIDSKTLKACSCLILENNQLTLNRIALRLALYNDLYCKTKSKILNFIGWYNWIITPEACFTSTLYKNSKCKDYNKICTYAEDMCAWYAMIKNNEDLKIKISKSTPIYWRHSNKSISNSKIFNDADFKTKWQDDIFSMKKLFYKDLSFFNKLYTGKQIKIYSQTRQWPKFPKWLDYPHYMLKFIDCIMKLPKNKKIETEWVNKISQNIDAETKHYKIIKQNAEKFLSNS